jgi:hypothetical protein
MIQEETAGRLDFEGIALAGAYSVVEERGYRPQNMAGASARLRLKPYQYCGLSPDGAGRVRGHTPNRAEEARGDPYIGSDQRFEEIRDV